MRRLTRRGRGAVRPARPIPPDAPVTIAFFILTAAMPPLRCLQLLCPAQRERQAAARRIERGGVPQRLCARVLVCAQRATRRSRNVSCMRTPGWPRDCDHMPLQPDGRTSRQQRFTRQLAVRDVEKTQGMMMTSRTISADAVLNRARRHLHKGTRDCVTQQLAPQRHARARAFCASKNSTNAAELVAAIFRSGLATSGGTSRHQGVPPVLVWSKTNGAT